MRSRGEKCGSWICICLSERIVELSRFPAHLIDAGKSLRRIGLGAVPGSIEYCFKLRMEGRKLCSKGFVLNSVQLLHHGMRFEIGLRESIQRSRHGYLSCVQRLKLGLRHIDARVHLHGKRSSLALAIDGKPNGIDTRHDEWPLRSERRAMRNRRDGIVIVRGGGRRGAQVPDPAMHARSFP